MQLNELIKKVQSGEIDIVEHTHKIIEQTKKINREFNYFNNVSADLALEQAEKIKIKKNKKSKAKLLGVPVSVKDCIVVKGVESTAGSRILNGYKPVFNATSVQKCIDECAVIIGKTSQDEFGFGSFSVNVGVDFKTPLNPFDKERACGGSSGGSAGITQKADFPHLSLSESTGGSIVCPASFCGVIGLCPTYGRVSRYGLMDYSNSLDKIGPMGKSIEDVALMLEIISGHDANESTSLQNQKTEFTSALKKEGKLKIAMIKENFSEGVDKDVKENVLNSAEKFGDVEEISLPLTQKYGIATYYLIATAEASTNLAKYCGMRYGMHDELKGSFNEYFTNVRSENFGKEAKRRIIIGTFARMAGYRDAYYLKAMKLRTKMIEEYKKAFKKYDLLLSPTMPVVAPKIKDIEKMTPLQNYMMDIMTVGPNLAGLPHLTIPTGLKNGMPIGTMLIANHLEEGKLLQGGKLLLD